MIKRFMHKHWNGLVGLQARDDTGGLHNDQVQVHAFQN